MADIDQSLYTLRYNQVAMQLEAFGGGFPSWTTLSIGTPGITALTGDVTASGAGSVVATVVSAGGGTGTFTAGTVNSHIIQGTQNILSLRANNDGVTNGIQLGASDGTHILTIDSEHLRVGIRIASPQATLDVAGEATIDSLAVGGVDAIDPSAVMQVSNTVAGVLLPRMTTTQKNAIASPAEGLIVYDLTLHALCVFNGSVWQTITAS